MAGETVGSIGEFIPHRFRVLLYGEQGASAPICSGAFSEVTGLEAGQVPLKFKEGGRNWGEVQLSGVTTFPPVVLKRGMTEVADLWTWFEYSTRQANYQYRLQGKIQVLAPNGKDIALTWLLDNVLPIKFKGADLSSTANTVAIEELQLVHEGLSLVRGDDEEQGKA